MTMSPIQTRFVDEYLLDLNATTAWTRAGGTKDVASAKQLGWRALQDPEVAAAIAEGQAKRSKRTNIAADRVLEELAKVGFANIADYVTWDEAGKPSIDLARVRREQMAAISEMTVDADGKIKLKFNSKLEALDKIGRHLGMWNDKLRLGEDPDAPFGMALDSLDAMSKLSAIFEAARRRMPNAG